MGIRDRVASGLAVALLLIVATRAEASDPAVEALIKRQETLIDKGQGEQVLAEAKARLKEEDTAINRYLLGRAYGMTGKLEEAREQFDWALERDAANAYAYHGIGAYFLMKGRVDEAERYLQNAIRLDPKLTRAHLELGKLCLTRQDRLGAQREFLKVLEYEPDNTDVRLLLAYQYLKDKRWEMASQEFVIVLTKDGKNVAAHKGHGVALAYQKRMDEAIKEFRWVLENQPKDLDAYVFLVNLLREKDDKKGAIAVLEDLLKEVPKDSPVAKSVRQEIENIREGRTARKGSVTLPLLLEQLSSKRVEVRREAMSRLVELGIKPPPKAMVRAVMDKDPVVRTLAVRNLGVVGSMHVVALLEVLLHHPKDREKNARVRGACVQALGKLGDPSAIPVLLATLDNESLYVVNLCVGSLRDLSGRSFVVDPTQPLTEANRKEITAKWTAWWRGPRSFSKKAAAMESMVEIDARRMANYLVELLGDEPSISARARIAFRALTGITLGTAADTETAEGRDRLMKEAAIALTTKSPRKKKAK